MRRVFVSIRYDRSKRQLQPHTLDTPLTRVRLALTVQIEAARPRSHSSSLTAVAQQLQTQHLATLPIVREWERETKRESKTGHSNRIQDVRLCVYRWPCVDLYELSDRKARFFLGQMSWALSGVLPLILQQSINNVIYPFLIIYEFIRFSLLSFFSISFIITIAIVILLVCHFFRVNEFERFMSYKKSIQYVVTTFYHSPHFPRLIIIYPNFTCILTCSSFIFPTFTNHTRTTF